MPARPAVPNVLKVEFLWSLDGLPAANVKYVLYSGTAPTSGACTAIADSLINAWWEPVKAFIPGVYTLEACRVTDLSTDTGAEGTFTAGLTGEDENDSMPVGSAVLVNHTIGRRYRGGHPRTYYPPPGIDGFAQPAAWTSEVVAAYGNAEAAYALEATEFLDSGCQGVYNVNVSYVSDGSARVDPVVDQIVGSVVSGTCRTQRRRLTSSSY